MYADQSLNRALSSLARPSARAVKFVGKSQDARSVLQPIPAALPKSPRSSILATDGSGERYQPVEGIIPAFARCFCSISASLNLEEEAPRLRFSSLVSDRIARPRLENILSTGCYPPGGSPSTSRQSFTFSASIDAMSRSIRAAVAFGSRDAAWISARNRRAASKRSSPR